MQVINDRMCAQVDGEVVVFLIGMRINKLWKIHKWLPVAMAMPRMLRELGQNPDLGFLGAHSWFGRTIIVLQYWRSVEDLQAYAKNRDRAHLPAWAAFNRAVGKNGDVGIWHETYRTRDRPARIGGGTNCKGVVLLTGPFRVISLCHHKEIT